MSHDRKTLTTNAGAPVADNQNSLSAGRRGPLPVQDVALFEKHAHFHRERISERVVHAKASAAFGTLSITHDITRHTRAKLFQPRAQTPMSGTFLHLAGERGAIVAERDVGGFALKFCTDESNRDSRTDTGVACHPQAGDRVARSPVSILIRLPWLAGHPVVHPPAWTMASPAPAQYRGPPGAPSEPTDRCRQPLRSGQTVS